jgi:flagellar basal body-associated protein FliL
MFEEPSHWEEVNYMSNEDKSAFGGKNKILIITVASAVVFAALGFFGGMQYQKTKTPSFARQFANGQARQGANAQQQNGQNRGNFRPISGEIISSDDKSITVKLQDSSSKIVLVTDSTSINKAESATKDDLKVGEKVFVNGETNQDGSVTAQNIQLNPVMQGFGQ